MNRSDNGIQSILRNGTQYYLDNGSRYNIDDGTRYSLDNGTRHSLGNGTQYSLDNGTHCNLYNGSQYNGTQYNIDYDTLEWLTKALYVYLVPVVCIFGIFGNILSFKVFVFTSFRKYSSSIYIAALSLSDTTFLCALLLSWLSNGRIGLFFGHFPVWCHLMIYVTYVCSFLSVWYVVLIMIDRYIVVCHPLYVSQWCSKRKARIARGIVTVCGILLYVYTFFAAEVTGLNCTIQAKSFVIRILSAFIYVDTAITFVIPVAVIFFLNIIVIISIRRFQFRHRMKERSSAVTQEMESNVLSKAQYRITRTFILVSVMLLLTNVPSHGIRFYILLKGLIREEDSLLIQAQLLCQILYYINFATNFLLYSVSSRMFRRYLSFKFMCCCRCERRHNRQREQLYE